LDEFRQAAGADATRFPLSVIVTPHAHIDRLIASIEGDLHIESFEIKPASLPDVERLVRVPRVELYFEVPLQSRSLEMLNVIAGSGARVKVRMGGVTADAFPTSESVAEMLVQFSRCGLAFKATAGLHHLIRSRHTLTSAASGPAAAMHGFMNLFCAATLLNCGGHYDHLVELLEEQDPGAWRIDPESISWRDYTWTADQISETRHNCMTSFGSCSFDEPIHDLEALQWL
jgi:hypothetical protein